MFTNGDKYNGGWKDDLKHGIGKFFWSDGRKYEGDWASDKKNGKGILFFSKDLFYDGSWLNDVKHGRGVCIFPGGKYEGEWISGRKHGKGVFSWEEGDKYEAQWNGNTMNGKGIFVWFNGDKYECEWKDGVRHGKELLSWASGEDYKGNWREGKREPDTRREEWTENRNKTADEECKIMLHDDHVIQVEETSHVLVSDFFEGLSAKIQKIMKSIPDNTSLPDAAKMWGKLIKELVSFNEEANSNQHDLSVMLGQQESLWEQIQNFHQEFQSSNFTESSTRFKVEIFLAKMLDAQKIVEEWERTLEKIRTLQEKDVKVMLEISVSHVGPSTLQYHLKELSTCKKERDAQFDDLRKLKSDFRSALAKSQIEEVYDKLFRAVNVLDQTKPFLSRSMFVSKELFREEFESIKRNIIVVDDRIKELTNGIKTLETALIDQFKILGVRSQDEAIDLLNSLHELSKQMWSESCRTSARIVLLQACQFHFRAMVKEIQTFLQIFWDTEEIQKIEGRKQIIKQSLQTFFELTKLRWRTPALNSRIDKFVDS